MRLKLDGKNCFLLNWTFFFACTIFHTINGDFTTVWMFTKKFSILFTRRNVQWDDSVQIKCFLPPRIYKSNQIKLFEKHTQPLPIEIFWLFERGELLTKSNCANCAILKSHACFDFVKRLRWRWILFRFFFRLPDARNGSNMKQYSLSKHGSIWLSIDFSQRTFPRLCLSSANTRQSSRFPTPSLCWRNCTCRLDGKLLNLLLGSNCFSLCQ